MKKFLSLILLISMVSALLCACSLKKEEATSSDDKIENTVASTESNDEYENTDVFEKAREYGYKVDKYDFSPYFYASFSLNGSSIVISSGDEPNGNILLYNKEISEADIRTGRFAFFNLFYSDKRSDSRNEYGHWTFTNEHKKELLNILKTYKENGIIAFANSFSDATSYMTDDYSTLINSHNLTVRYQKVDSKYYRFIFFDNSGKAVWFTAEYTEADIPKNKNAFGLNTWDGYTGNVIGLKGVAYGEDLVKKDGKLHSVPERIADLDKFFQN